MCPRVGAHQQKYPQKRIFFLGLRYGDYFESMTDRLSGHIIFLVILYESKTLAGNFNNRVGFGATSSKFSTDAKFFHNIT